ncbi:MAG: hypothetical protein KAZ87_11575 [Spirochaetes bacterium]|nr:hypothetical protein [Spirochaetota bacterium]
MEKSTIFGLIEISYPNENEACFTIFENLADLFDCEVQSDAVKLLKDALKIIPDLKPKPDIDYESDFTHITSRSPDTILKVANTIHNLINLPKPSISLEEHNLISLDLKSWKRPKRQKWNIGDIFAIKLDDGFYSYGQVLGIHTYKSPTNCLFEIKSDKLMIPIEAIISSRILTILHCDACYLSDYSFQIIYNHKVLANPNSGPWGKCESHVGQTTGSDGHILDLANAWWGLIPWNVMHDEDYYDQHLLKGVARSKLALVLSIKDRIKYRKDVLKIDENNVYIK